MPDNPARQLLAEIEEEVQRKRASGELPADFERQLDLAFAELAPEGAVEADFSTLMDRLEATAAIDTKASVESSRPGVAHMKRMVGKAIDWDLRHLAAEASRVNQRLVRALQLLDDRVRALEDGASLQGPVLPPELAGRVAGPLPDGPWVELAGQAFSAVPGRVLLAECRHGAQLRALQASGMDAYGVEPSPLFVTAREAAVDVRQESAIAHLRTLPRASLGGVILAGCTDILPVAALVQLVDAVLTRLCPGGRIMVVSRGPAPPQTVEEKVVYDLAPGRPLHAETWAALLPGRGFGPVQGPTAAGAERQPYAVIATA